MAQAVPAGAVSWRRWRSGCCWEPRRDLQHVVAKKPSESATPRSRSLSANMVMIGAAAGDATVAGLVNVATIVWAYRRPSRVARQFLVRAPQLDPALRERWPTGSPVVAAAATRVPPQLVLAAVLAERHRRELLRRVPLASAGLAPWAQMAPHRRPVCPAPPCLLSSR